MPEVLPLVTTHDVEVVVVVEVLVVLGIGAQGIGALDYLLPTVAAIISGLGCGGINIGPLLTLGQIGTQSQVESQILKTVNLIVDIGITDEVAADGTVVSQVEHGNGVGGCQRVAGIGPCAVVEGRAVAQPLEVTTEVVIQRVGGRNGLGGIHPDCCADGATIGIAVLTPHELTVQVQAQVVVKERGIQVQRGGETLEVTRLQNTLLVGIT